MISANPFGRLLGQGTHFYAAFSFEIIPSWIFFYDRTLLLFTMLLCCSFGRLVVCAMFPFAGVLWGETCSLIFCTLFCYDINKFVLQVIFIPIYYLFTYLFSYLFTCLLCCFLKCYLITHCIPCNFWLALYGCHWEHSGLDNKGDGAKMRQGLTLRLRNAV